jgi:diphthamide synthase (EF-2-diphthine--ammonia ligase)
MKGLFPLWKKDTTKLADTFIDLGFKTIITCVDTNVLGKIFTGRGFNKEFLTELPANIDPCGENGEFHSFVYDGPIFKKRIAYDIGEVVLRENRFCYCDLIPCD